MSHASLETLQDFHVAHRGHPGYKEPDVDHQNIEDAMDSEIKVSSGGQLTINAAGLLLLFGWACYTILTWLTYRYLPDSTASVGVIIGAGYLLAVGGLLAFMATQALKFGQHLTYRRAIGRTSSPVGFWFLTLSMGGVGTALLGAGVYALGKALLFR